MAQPKFIWVYDCGSVTKGVRLDLKVNELKVFCREKELIDILAISHFDSDHISGVAILLGEFAVDILLLPYAPLWERLIVAFESGLSTSDPLFGFYLDPIGFLTGLEGVEIGRIIMVQPGGEAPAGGEGSSAPDFPPDERPWYSSVRLEKPPEDEVGDGILYSKGNVGFLVPGSAITVQGLWEFVPYNAPRKRSHRPDFAEEVGGFRDGLLIAGNSDERRELLDQLKEMYDREFGADDRSRNIISLFLYSGPIYDSWEQCKILSAEKRFDFGFPWRHPCYYRANADAPGFSSRSSILYTGDSYLKTPVQFEDLKRAVGDRRLGMVGVFQVNHHGAERNWHPGLAGKIKPLYSVFSSDPERGNTYHPDAVVLRDFWLYRPIQVNWVGCSFCGWLLR